MPTQVLRGAREALARMRSGADTRSPQASPTLTMLTLWLGILAFGVALIYLRYDWDLEGGRFAERGFVLSAYLFVILLPTFYYLARRLLHDATAAAGLTAVVFVVTTLPYELLGLDDLYYYATRAPYFTIDDFPPSLEFLPGGTLRAFPSDWLFMPLLFATGATGIWGVWWLRKRAGFTPARRIPTLLTIAFAVICLQAFTHSSMRAPYTYLAYFQKPEAEEHWYHVYHFDDGSGATEADQFVFTALEDYFHGAPREGDNALIRRPFSFYMASQASFFVNTFYAWLALNCLFWLAAVVATARLVARLATERAGLIAGALTAVGPGFLAFVATPAMYLQNYAAIAIALCLFEELVVRSKGRELGMLALFTGALTLCALVYDLLPLFFVLLAYGLARGVRARSLLLSLGAAYLAARGFTFVVSDVLQIFINPGNEDQLSKALNRTTDFLVHPNLADWYDATVEIVPSFLQLLMQAFFVVPLVLAVFGLRKLRDPQVRILVGGLLLMGLAIVAVFQIGHLRKLETLPRLVYVCFPAVYLLAAVALDSLAPARPPPGTLPHSSAWDRARIAAPWVVVGVMFVLANVDIFGYPTLYVEFFVNDPPAFLPE